MNQLPFVSANGEIEIVKYTDKSAFIRGTAKNPKSTLVIKDRIKNDLNASWNKFLKDPKTGQTIAAWLVSQNKVQQAIDLIKQVGGAGGAGGANNNTNANNNANDDGNDADDQPLIQQNQNAAADNNNDDTKNKTNNSKEKIVLDSSNFPILSADGQIECIKYSENSMVVRSISTNPTATRSISEKLKTTFEAKYNGYLKDAANNNAPFPGWLVFNNHFEALKTYLQTEVTNTPAADPTKVKIANNNPPAPAMFATADQKIKAIRYSEKAIAVNLNNIRDDTLYKHLTGEELGGKYLRNLTDPGNNTKFAGVIFGNGNKDKLKDFLTRYHVGSGKIPPTRRGREGADEYE